jgi:hypothetical protein
VEAAARFASQAASPGPNGPNGCTEQHVTYLHPWWSNIAGRARLDETQEPGNGSSSERRLVPQRPSRTHGRRNPRNGSGRVHPPTRRRTRRRWPGSALRDEGSLVPRQWGMSDHLVGRAGRAQRGSLQTVISRRGSHDRLTSQIRTTSFLTKLHVRGSLWSRFSSRMSCVRRPSASAPDYERENRRGSWRPPVRWPSPWFQRSFQTLAETIVWTSPSANSSCLSLLTKGGGGGTDEEKGSNWPAIAGIVETACRREGRHANFGSLRGTSLIAIARCCSTHNAQTGVNHPFAAKSCRRQRSAWQVSVLTLWAKAVGTILGGSCHSERRTFRR